MGAAQQVKIYRYLDINDLVYDAVALEKAPVGLNYKTHLNRSLIPKRTLVQGELQKVEWFADYNQLTKVYGDLVLVVDITYDRDSGGFALRRETTRTWIAEDESNASPVKVTEKYYEGAERDKEGIRRRGNIIAQVKVAAAGHLIFGAVDPTDPVQAQTQLNIGRTFTDARAAMSESFIAVSSQAIYTDIQSNVSSPDVWLDDVLRIGYDGTDPILHPGSVTVRDYILSELNIWGL